MTFSEPARTRIQRWVAILAMTAAYVHCVAISWGKWGDLLIDAPWDLDDARTLMQPGSQLYVSFLYPYGPLIPYVNMLLFKLFGSNSWVLFYSGLTAAALMTAILYRTARLFIGRLGATIAAVAFPYICGFAKLTPNGSFNWAMSYRSCAQYGSLLAAASTFFLLRHALKKKPLDFWLSVLFLALAGLSKIESLTAATAPHLAFIVLALWARTFNWKLHLAGYAASLALFFGVFGYFYSIAGQSLFADNLFQLAFHPVYKLFALKTMGADNWPVSFTQLAISLAYLAAACLLPIILARFVEAPNGTSNQPLRILSLIAGVCAALLFWTENLESTFRFVPFLAAAIILQQLWVGIKSKDQRATLIPMALLWTFVIGSLTRSLFRTVSYHYGFYLLPPALPALAVFFFRVMPGWWPSRPSFKIISAYTCVGMFTGLILIHLQYSAPAYAERTAEIRTPRGSMLIAKEQIMMYEGERVRVPTGEYFQEIVAFLSALPKDTRVMVVPHGEAGLTYFCDLKNYYKDYISCVPTEKGRYDDAEFLTVVQAQPPDYIIRIALDLSEYNYTSFGQSYSKKTWAWLQPQYDIFKIYGPRYIVVLKRKATK
ncbi:MAG: glycosyltransferase family 39 protein [Planctomycetota bacterium]